MNLGQFIMIKRKERGLTQEELGKFIKKDKSFISRLEKNKVSSLKDDMIVPLANALGIPVMALFDGFDINGEAMEVEEISTDELKIQVRNLLDKCKELNDIDRKLILTNLEIVCDNKDKKVTILKL